jgi:hypothetical protein
MIILAAFATPVILYVLGFIWGAITGGGDN